MKVVGRLSFRDAASRRATDTLVGRLQTRGVAPDALAVDGLTLKVATEAPDDAALRADLRELAQAAWGGALSCEVATSAVPEVLYAGGPDAAGVRPLGSLLPVVHSSRFRGELARVGSVGDPAAYRFQRQDCRVLVVYALSASHDKPDGDDPRWVYGTTPDGLGLLAAQPAPTSRIMRRAEFFQQVHDGVADARLDPWAAVHLHECLTWAAETGCRWFAYMLEPLAIAGDGTAAARAQAAEEAPVPRPSAAQMGTADTVAAMSVSLPAHTAPAAPAVVAPAVSRPIPVTGPGMDMHGGPGPGATPHGAMATGATPHGGLGSTSAPTAPGAAWQVGGALTGQGDALPSGQHRSGLLRALSRNIGEDGLVVARRAAAHVLQCGAPGDALLELLGIVNDLMGAPAIRGDALFAIAVLGVEHRVSLPERAFAPLLDATLRSMTMNAERRPGYEGLLALAPRTAAYQALRQSLGVS
ncbi:MAG: hypothetical protein H6726_12295 [Sandaracinaceae bacterium]|nr:hypothetical protein [Sandaracinaceae bacterium]